MSNDKPDQPEYLSVRELRDWLSEELRNVHKECELRTQEATALVTAYAAGELTPAEALKRFQQYDKRWGDPLGGVYASSYLTDGEILKAIDRNNAEQIKETGWSEREHGRRGSKDPDLPPK